MSYTALDKNYDVLKNVELTHQLYNGDGFVKIIDCMPRLAPIGRTMDYAIVQMARASVGSGLKSEREDNALINYLVRNKHTSPLEGIEFKFMVRCPIFIARQVMRHRTFSFNEFSARYSILPDQFYKTTPRRQSSLFKQSSDDSDITDEQIKEYEKYLNSAENLYKEYDRMISLGISKELARIALPVSIYTEFYMKGNLHNFLHFIKLRMDLHAQNEIRELATAMYSIIKTLVPVATGAWEKYTLHAITLSQYEIDAINSKNPSISNSKTLDTEYKSKLKLLGLNFNTSIDETEDA